MKNCVVGTYVGCVQFAEGYRDGGKFYDVNGNETSLSGVSKCVKFELVIEKQDKNLIWGVYKFRNPFTNKDEVDPLIGSRVSEHYWRIRDTDEVGEIGSLSFENKCNLIFSMDSGKQPGNDKKPGFFELINGPLKKK
jgi:hypothetical protein